MNDAISPKMRRKTKGIIGEALVEMSNKAQFQLLYLAKEYEQDSQELSVLRKILQIRSKEKQKLEETIP